MCKTQIIRVEGCFHIKCPVCDYEWCWKCGREYEAEHSLGCISVWSPLQPKIFQSDSLESETREVISSVKKLLPKLEIVGELLLIPIMLLIWPYSVIFKMDFTDFKLNFLHNLKYLFLSLCLGIILLPILPIGALIAGTHFVFKTIKKTMTEKKVDENAEQPRWVTGNAEQFNYANPVVDAAPRQDEHDLPADIPVDNGPPGANDDDDYFGNNGGNNNPQEENVLDFGNNVIENIVVHPLARITVDNNQKNTLKEGSIDLLQGFEFPHASDSIEDADYQDYEMDFN
jgi:hypothetical protein